MSENYEAQRTLERKALKNVRDLLDKIEADERDKTKNAWKLAGRVIVGTVLAVAIGIVAVKTLWTPNRFAKDAVPTGTRQMSSADYVDQSLARIERIANARFQTKMVGFIGRVELDIAIGPNGYSKDIAVTQSSWNAALDGTVTQLVKGSEPFGALPDVVRKDGDVLHVTRTFRIERVDSNRGMLIIERGATKGGSTSR